MDIDSPKEQRQALEAMDKAIEDHSRIVMARAKCHGERSMWL